MIKKMKLVILIILASQIFTFNQDALSNEGVSSQRTAGEAKQVYVLDPFYYSYTPVYYTYSDIVYSYWDYWDWYYPSYSIIKENHSAKLSYYHERLFMVYLKIKNINYKLIYGLQHYHLSSHHDGYN